MEHELATFINLSQWQMIVSSQETNQEHGETKGDNPIIIMIIGNYLFTQPGISKYQDQYIQILTAKDPCASPHPNHPSFLPLTSNKTQ